MAIVHHRDSHRNLDWRPIPQPRQMGSPEGGCYGAGEVLRKSTRGNYGKRVSRTTQKTAHRASHHVHRVPYLPQWSAVTDCVSPAKDHFSHFQSIQVQSKDNKMTTPLFATEWCHRGQSTSEA